MSTAHVCPRCEGNRRVHNARSGQMEDCPTCQGQGVVFEHDGPQEGAHTHGIDDARDLTYRP